MMRMTRRTRGVAIVVGAALCLAAYVSATYILDPAVQDSGGGRAGSSSYRLDASIGGPVIAPAATGGTAESANYKLQVNSVTVLAGKPPTGGGGGGGCAPGVAAPAAIPSALLALVAALAARRVSRAARSAPHA